MASTDSIDIDIDIHALPSSPDSPLWESPRRTVEPLGEDGPVVTLPFQITTTIGRVLNQLSLNLEVMVRNGSSLQELETFLSRYEVWGSPGTGNTNSRIHPLVQEWFDYRNTLQIAVQKDRMDVVRYLLDRGFNVNGAAISAMCGKSHQLVKEMIEQGKWDINEPTAEIMPPILGTFVASYDMLQWLLARGADPKAVAPYGKYTIFHSAAQYASVPCIALLVSAAPSCILQGSHSADVIFHAATTHSSTNNRIPVIQFLLENGAPIDMVAGCGEHENGHSCDLVVYGRKNGLHYAVEYGKQDLVEFLLDQGADIEKKTWGMTTNYAWVSVEELAEMCGHVAIRELLASHVSRKGKAS